MSNSQLSFNATNSRRETLLARNLAPYSISGVWSNTITNYNTEITFSNFNVIDSPNTYISRTPFLNTNSRFNTYSPDNGFTYEITYNDTNPPAKPNSGEYGPNETNMDILYEGEIDAAFNQNIFGPEGGFNLLFTIEDAQLNNKIHLPYWNPPVFTPSSYSAYQLYINPNAQGTNGSITEDSKLAQIGAIQVRDLFQARIDNELLKLGVERVNLENISNPFYAALNTFGNQPAISPNFNITVPEGPIGRVAGFIARVSGVYTPVSPIPGDYFNESLFGDSVGNKTNRTLGIINRLTGGVSGPLMNLVRNPSETFLAFTSNGQKSVLFKNLNANKYRPNYDGGYGGIRGILQTGFDLIKGGSYNNYLGSRISDNSQITSPPNEVPTNASGQQVQAPVYGPDQLGILFEGNEGRLNFGLAGKTLADGGSIDGGFVWVSPKYKDNAGFNVRPGGSATNVDDDFKNLIKSSYQLNESTNLTFRTDSILDNTQRLVDSGDKVTGANRLKHVGNAINQVSKVFNDGYKEITKGSKVISYVEGVTNNEIIGQGREVGVEYCRLFTKDTPYYTYGDLQKTDGITKFGRKFNYSVLDNTFNLNIAPGRLPDSTNIKQNSDGKFVAKKYMLSIENLAWRTSSQPGYTYDDLPLCERGPNGGRVMWFPPYDLKFNDTSNASFQGTSFLGRPEPMYTYKETTRTGSLSFKIIVDHPSVLNTIIKKQLKSQNKERVESIVNSFFAGCTKYDIYELAKKFNTIPLNDLVRYQLAIENTKTSRESAIELAKSIPRENSGGGDSNGETSNSSGNQSQSQTNNEIKKYVDLQVYFDHAIPGSTGTDYQVLYNTYITKKPTYSNKATTLYTSEKCKGKEEECNKNREIVKFFDTIENNFTKLKEFIKESFSILNAGGSITMSIFGSASSPDDPKNNEALSTRRNESVLQYIKNQIDENGKKMLDYINNKKFIIKPQVNEGESTRVIPEGGVEIDCTKNVLSGNLYDIYSVSAMACRRVLIKSIEATTTNNQNNIPKEETKDNPNDYFNQIPLQTRTVANPTQISEGISKKILRNLFSECDYFDVLKEEEPMIYDSIRDKIKFFNPAFHSMTPEGLNSRLVFLNQCVRPGQTIPTIGADGRPKFDDALNTSFGTPPVLILRIGDFYNTKIIPDSISFSYDPLNLDLNPEGIGLQPMIASVSLNFKIIGGMGLAKPVEELQNALSFNYYANTEIYDERATTTDKSYEAIDKEFLDLLNTPQVSTNTNDIQNNLTTNSSLIGEIVPDSTEITYNKIMDQLLDETSGYFEAVFNQLESLNESQNYGWVQFLNYKRDFTSGDIKTLAFDDDSLINVEIYGKSNH